MSNGPCTHAAQTVSAAVARLLRTGGTVWARKRGYSARHPFAPTRIRPGKAGGLRAADDFGRRLIRPRGLCALGPVLAWCLPRRFPFCNDLLVDVVDYRQDVAGRSSPAASTSTNDSGRFDRSGGIGNGPETCPLM